MDERVRNIQWSFKADEDLDEIFEFYLEHSPDFASESILSIISETEEVIFTRQWQADEFDPTCRRIIVKGKFRVVYKVSNNLIIIIAVYSTKKNPENFRKV